MTRSILDRIDDPAIVAFCVDGSEWPRSLLSTTLIPDKWMALIERADGRRWFVPAGEEPKTDRGDKLLLVRNRPITVPLDVRDTRASDGHFVDATCELLARWHAREDDLAALLKTLTDTDELTLDRLANLVAREGGAAALRRLIHEHDAATLLHDDLRTTAQALFEEELRRFMFAGGLTLEQVATLRASSPSFVRQEQIQRDTAQRMEDIKARQLVEDAALAATKRRLDHLGEIFTKLSSAADREDMQWHDLLPALSPAERGRLLEQLWRVSPNRRVTEAIVVVAGRQCLWLAPTQTESPRRRAELPEDLGPLRSVSHCPQRQRLLIGAARGVWVVDATAGEVLGRFEVPGATAPRTGFNAATFVGDGLLATHSQLGAWYWPLDAPDEAEVRCQPAEGHPKAIRAATTTPDGRAVYTADHHVRVESADGSEQELSPPAPAVLQCVAVDGHVLYAGAADGAVLSLDLQHPDAWAIVHRSAGAVESVFPRRWNDLVELVTPAGRGVAGIFPREGIIARLLETPMAIRRAWACDDVLVALSDLRDRLFVQSADEAGTNAVEIPVARITGHTIQDACLVTGDAARLSDAAGDVTA